MTSTRYLSRTEVGRRYGRCARTIQRWTKDGILPAPDLFVGEREFWSEATLDAHDRQSSSAKSAPARRYNFVTKTVTG